MPVLVLTLDACLQQHWNSQRQIRGSAANWCFRYLRVVGCANPLSSPHEIAQRMATQHDWDAEDRALVRFMLVGELPENADTLVKQLDTVAVGADELTTVFRAVVDALPPEDVLPEQPTKLSSGSSSGVDDLLDFEYELTKRMLRLVEHYADADCFSVGLTASVRVCCVLSVLIGWCLLSSL